MWSAVKQTHWHEVFNCQYFEMFLKNSYKVSLVLTTTVQASEQGRSALGALAWHGAAGPGVFRPWGKGYSWWRVNYWYYSRGLAFWMIDNRLSLLVLKTVLYRFPISVDQSFNLHIGGKLTLPVTHTIHPPVTGNIQVCLRSNSTHFVHPLYLMDFKDFKENL